ncbi:MAG: hypothetical protein BJ554DRAFT_4358, partial [Olpidium bornovanus]
CGGTQTGLVTVAPGKLFDEKGRAEAAVDRKLQPGPSLLIRDGADWSTGGFGASSTSEWTQTTNSTQCNVHFRRERRLFSPFALTARVEILKLGKKGAPLFKQARTHIPAVPFLFHFFFFFLFLCFGTRGRPTSQSGVVSSTARDRPPRPAREA